MDEMRATVREANPNMRSMELCKKLGVMWNDLPEVFSRVVPLGLQRLSVSFLLIPTRLGVAGLHLLALAGCICLLPTRCASQDTKKKYEDQAAKAQEDYKVALEEYKKEYPEQDIRRPPSLKMRTNAWVMFVRKVGVLNGAAFTHFCPVAQHTLALTCSLSKQDLHLTLRSLNLADPAA
eukprot:3465039-Rhodomonas_salina.1